MLPATASAATKYWVGTGSGSLSANGNWSTTAGSSCGQNKNTVAPTSVDAVVFTSSCVNNAAATSAISPYSITVRAGYTGTLSLSGGILLTVNGVTIGDEAATVRMGANSTLVLTGSGTPLSGSGTFDATTYTPNSVLYKGEGIIGVPGYTYNRLTLSSQFKAAGKNVLTLATGENNAYAGPLADPDNGYLYAGLCTTPAKVTKINTADFTRVGVLTFETGEDCIKSLAIDTVNGFAYFGTNTSPAQIVKVRLSDFSRVSSLTLASGQNGTDNSMAIDTANGYLYMATATTPSTLVKIRLSDFTQVASLPLNSGDGLVLGIALDTQNGFAYLGTQTNTGLLVKVRLSDLTRTASLTLGGDTGDEWYVHAIFVDPAHDAGYAVLPVSPTRLVKFRLSDFTQTSFGFLTHDYAWLGSIDAENGYLYVPHYAGNISKVRLRDFQEVGYINAASTSTVGRGGALDAANGYGYMATTDSPAKIFRYQVSTPYRLGTAASQTLTVQNGLLIGTGSQVVSTDASTYNPTIAVSTQLFINSGAYLKASTAGTLSVTGNWLNGGRFASNAGTVTVAGPSQIRSTGSGSFANLTISSGTATLGSSIDISSALSVGAGTTLAIPTYALTATTASISNLGTISETSGGKIVHAGSISVSPSSLAVGGTVGVSLTDSDANIDGTSIDTATVYADSEAFTLTETAVASGVFTGSIPTAHNPETSGNGIVEHDDRCAFPVTPAYIDPQDASDTQRATATVTDSGVSCEAGGGGGGSSGGGGAGGGRHTAAAASSPSAVSPTPPMVVPSAPSSSDTDTSARAFADVPSQAWFASVVTELADLGIVSGYKDSNGNPTGMFGPADPVTRAQILKMALLASGKTETDGTPANLSVKNTWAAGFVKTAENLHVSLFTPSFKVHDNATRGEVVQILMEAANPAPPDVSPSTFSDVPATHRYALAIAAAQKLGIIEGDRDAAGNLTGTFRPDAPVNRAEAAKMVARLLTLPLNHAAAVTPDSSRRTVTALSTLRADARITAVSRGTVSAGTVVTLIRTVDVWAEIRLPDGRTGFVVRTNLAR